MNLKRKRSPCNHLFLLQSYRKQDTALDYQMVGLFPNVFLRFVASGAFRQPLVVAIIIRRVESVFSEFHRPDR